MINFIWLVRWIEWCECDRCSISCGCARLHRRDTGTRACKGHLRGEKLLVRGFGSGRAARSCSVLGDMKAEEIVVIRQMCCAVKSCLVSEWKWLGISR